MVYLLFYSYLSPVTKDDILLYIISSLLGERHWSHMTGKARQEHMATKPIESTITRPTKQLCKRYEQAIQLLGKRWTGLILDTMLEGPQRFCEMTAIVEGLSDRVLSDRLRELESEGVVERIVYPQIPVRVEYRLTEKGRDLRPVVQAIHEWAEKWIPLPDTQGVEV